MTPVSPSALSHAALTEVAATRADWTDGAALALFFVIEGIVPFINPGALKRAFALLASLGDRELRLAGLGSMVVGVVLLFLARS